MTKILVFLVYFNSAGGYGQAMNMTQLDSMAECEQVRTFMLDNVKYETFVNTHKIDPRDLECLEIKVGK